MNTFRLTYEETKRLFHEAGYKLGEIDIDAIYRYVEGWPIATMMVMDKLDKDREYKGTEALDDIRPWLFYLFENAVFSQYTKSEQEMLINLSISDSLPKGLIQAITKENKHDLSELMMENIYNVGERRYYFYDLSKDFLREKRRTVPKGEQHNTFNMAADWCKKNGYLYDAVKYYGAGESYKEAWETILLFGIKRRNKDNTDILIESIQNLSEEFRESNPKTEIFLAALYVNNLRFADGIKLIEKVRVKLEATGKDLNSLGECYTAYGLMKYVMGESEYEKYFKMASLLLPHGSSMWNREMLLVDLGPGLNLQSKEAGELEKSIESVTAAVPYIADILAGQGMGLDLLCKCEAAFLTGDIKKALELGYQALYTAQSYSQWDIVGNALLIILRSYILQGDYDNIIDTLEHVDRYKRDSKSKDLGIWDIIYGWFYSEVGEADKVVLWVRNAIQYGYAPISIERSNMIRIRCLVSGKRYLEALALLEQFEHFVKLNKSVIMQIHIEIYKAVSYYAIKKRDKAVESLYKAYELSEGNNIVTPFTEYGSKLRALLLYAKKKPGKLPVKWLDQIYTKANTFAKKHTFIIKLRKQNTIGSTRDFGLSEREIEILTNISQGLTREEIGKLLYLSPNTIKSVLKQIYAKLGAINAADAVRLGITNHVI